MTKGIKRGSQWKEKLTGNVYQVFEFCDVMLVRDSCQGVIYMKDDKFYVAPIDTFKEKFVYHGHYYYKGADLRRLKGSGWDPGKDTR